MNPFAPQPPHDDLPPHLASPEAFARWCREQPEELRQLEMTARRIELGEFGDVPPELQVKVRRFLEVRQRLRAVEAVATPALAEFQGLRKLLRQSKLPSDHLLAQIEVMEQRLLRCEPFREEWAEFHLQLAAFQAEQATSEIKRGVRFAIWLDAQDGTAHSGSPRTPTSSNCSRNGGPVPSVRSCWADCPSRSEGNWRSWNASGGRTRRSHSPSPCGAGVLAGGFPGRPAPWRWCARRDAA